MKSVVTILYTALLCCSFALGGSSSNEVLSNSNSTNLGSGVINNQKVFVSSMPRSGSSFLGDMFGHNPEFVYLFEPLRGFSEDFAHDSCSRAPKDPIVSTVVKDLYDCKFSTLKQYNHEHPWRGHMYSWERIADLSGKDKAALCLPPNDTSIKARHTSIALKEIEMWSPKLDWLYDTLGDDLHVIWLVRDVRGWVSSWMVGEEKNNFFQSWGYDKQDLWERYASCGMLESTLLDASELEEIKGVLKNSSAPPHLKMAAWWTLDNAVAYYYSQRFTGKLLLVRYEDISSNSVDLVHQIYEFLGRPVNEHVLRHLAWATKDGNVGDRYNRYRKSGEMVEIWRKRLSASEITSIERIAKSLFDVFGYKTTS